LKTWWNEVETGNCLILNIWDKEEVPEDQTSHGSDTSESSKCCSLKLALSQASEGNAVCR